MDASSSSAESRLHLKVTTRDGMSILAMPEEQYLKTFVQPLASVLAAWNIHLASPMQGRVSSLVASVETLEQWKKVVDQLDGNGIPLPTSSLGQELEKV